MKHKGQAGESQGDRHVLRNHYDQLILSKIEHSLNTIIPAAIPLVLLMAVNDYLRSNIFILSIDISVIVSLVALSLLKNEISNKLKIILMALLTVIAGFTSIFVFGYAGTGLLTLLVGCMLVTGFLSRRTSIVYALLLAAGVVVFIALVYFHVITYDITNPKFNPSLVPGWISPLIVFIISLLILIVIVNVIKKYLGMSLSKTENQLKTINQFAFYDTLTGLPNKNKLLSDNKELQDDAGMVVLFSIDGYTLINSIYGQEVTDEIIIAISEFMESKKEQFLQYARTDVNEFAFVWKKSREDAFLPFVEQSFQEIQKHRRLAKWKRGIHIHLGYYQCVPASDSFLSAYQKAKIALQEAKDHHAILPVKYETAMEARLRAEYDFRHLVEAAIANNEFSVYYQEKVDNQTNQVVGVEALARWNSEDLGLVSPTVFMPVIEQSMQYSVFGNQIIHLVVDDYPRLCQKYSPDIIVSVNVSSQHLLSQDFISFISSESILGQIKPQNFIFEITEETLIDNIEYALTVTKDIKQLGYQISLDDFGSGYSSLSYLSKLSFDEVKIDKSFVDQLTTDVKIVKAVEIIASLKDVYGFSVVAEGVETQEQYDILKKIGHFIIQGYYFSKPEPLA